ncbi:MAG TPA: phenylalanine--tRNA ligase subunit beta [Terriglobales bacterium]|nr:phenylalanine--tRNA ligase subunit beta [Terriglobales bacterium]
MKLSAQWIRDFVEVPVDNRRLAEALTSVGMGVEGMAGQGEDTVFEMEIGTNRPDAMNHYGLAREASAIYDVRLRSLAPKLPPPSANASSSGPGTAAAPFPIAIEDGEGCARFTARILREVRVGASPAKIIRRLASLDQRAINNAVDATNYVLWEMGKPTHVFDLDLLAGGKIIVRRAREGETLKTLDGVDRKLSGEDLVVADAEKPVALAGTMGGFDTMITERTRNVLIESAWWDPLIVRKMSRRHGLHTDASHRFERGADFEATVLSCDRVAELILQSGGGRLIGEPIDVIARRIDQAPVELRTPEVQRILGARLEETEIVRILRGLGFELVAEEAETFAVQIPSWRLDVEREIDLIEEIARLYGYDKIPNRLPAFSGSVIESPEAAKDRKLRTTLLALGYHETVSLNFLSHEEAEQFSDVPIIEIENPLSEEASVMHTSLVPGMLTMLAYNLNRGNDNLRLFESAKVFAAVGPAAVEMKRIAMGATGSALTPSVHQASRPFSFFDLKGDVESLLASFAHKSLCYDAETADYYHPGRSARAVMDGESVAQFGQLHPATAATRKLRQDVYIAELYLDRLYRRGLREFACEPLPRYPAVERDFSFLFPDSLAFEQIRRACYDLGLREVRSLLPVEIFRGGSIPPGTYSLLLRLTFQANDRTLREDEVAHWSAQIMKAWEALGGTLRSQ